MFNTVNYLLYEKNKTELDSNLLQEFNAYFTVKSFSYYDSGKYCNFINDTLNVYSGIFKTKEDQFKFFDVIIPKIKRRKSEYIKGSKNEKTKVKDDHIPEFFSRRELDMIENRHK